MSALVSEPLVSRAADNLFWVGRHLERIFFTIRLLHIVLSEQMNLKDVSEQNNKHLEVLLHAATHLTGTYPGFIAAHPLSQAEMHKQMLSLFSDQQRAGTIASNIEDFFYAAFNIRDLWSQNTWRCIDSIRDDWHAEAYQLMSSPAQLSRPLDKLNLQMAAFSGLTSESMTRESGWILLQIGRRLERALALISFLRATVVQKQPETQMYPVLESVLQVTDSFSLYQRRYRSVVCLPLLLELLLGDKSHPYSLLFQLQHLKDAVATLPGQNKNRLSLEQRLILKAYIDIQLCDFNSLLNNDEGDGIHSTLDTQLKNMTEALWEFSDIIAQRYFNHVQVKHQLSPVELEKSL